MNRYVVVFEEDYENECVHVAYPLKCNGLREDAAQLTRELITKSIRNGLQWQPGDPFSVSAILSVIKYDTTATPPEILVVDEWLPRILTIDEWFDQPGIGDTWPTG